jgi:hypothetical protein
MCNRFKKIYRQIEKEYFAYPSRLSLIYILLGRLIGVLFIGAMLPITVKLFGGSDISNLIDYVVSGNYFDCLYRYWLILPFIYIFDLICFYDVFDRWYLEKAEQIKKDYDITVATYTIQELLKAKGQYVLYFLFMSVCVVILILKVVVPEIGIWISIMLFLLHYMVDQWQKYKESDRKLNLIKRGN